MTSSTAITVDYQEPSIRSLTINASYGGAQRHRRLIAAMIILGGQVVGTGLPTRSGKARFYTPSRPFHASSPHVQRNKTGILCARFYNQRIRGQHVDRLIS
jgi:hypothetical protein